MTGSGTLFITFGAFAMTAGCAADAKCPATAAAAAFVALSCLVAAIVAEWEPR